jgi:hypothetical protein
MNHSSKSAWAGPLAFVAATAAAATGAALYAQSAGAQSPTRTQSSTHTLHIVDKQLQDKIIHGVDVAADQDFQHGSPSGYLASSCRVDFHTHRAHCDVAMARSGGLLYAHAIINVQTGRGHGTVTGGTRHFHDARGTVTLHGSTVTIGYHV